MGSFMGERRVVSIRLGFIFKNISWNSWCQNDRSSTFSGGINNKHRFILQIVNPFFPGSLHALHRCLLYECQKIASCGKSKIDILHWYLLTNSCGQTDKVFVYFLFVSIYPSIYRIQHTHKHVRTHTDTRTTLNLVIDSPQNPDRFCW